MDDTENKGTAPEDGGEEEKEHDTKEDEYTEDDEYEKELERIKGKDTSKYSPLEKAQYNLKKMAEEVERLGGDVKNIFGSSEEEKGKKTFDIENPEQLQELIQKAVKEQVEGVRSTFAKAEVETRISKLAQTPTEKKLIEHHFNNTIKATGDLDEDVQNAWLIANKHKIRETIEALRTKKGASDSISDGIGGGQKRQVGKKPNVSSREKAFAESRGLVWSETDGRYVSKSRLEYLKKRK